ncbi:MAG: hypothetical protein GX421_07140 [Caldisericales bacterium]|nr:hypothetical protein [Caldisericales bacterium]
MTENNKKTSYFINKYGSFVIAMLGFVALVAVSFFLNRNETDGKLTWFWGSMVFFAAWPIESAIFTFLAQSFWQHFAGAMMLAFCLALGNFLQTQTLTWSLLLAPACLLWPVAYAVWALVKKISRSNLLASLAGWFVVSAVAVAAEWLVMKRFTWSLTLVICLAFWPAVSLAYIQDDNPRKTQTEAGGAVPDTQIVASAEEPEQEKEDKNE